MPKYGLKSNNFVSRPLKYPDTVLNKMRTAALSYMGNFGLDGWHAADHFFNTVLSAEQGDGIFCASYLRHCQSAAIQKDIIDSLVHEHEVTPNIHMYQEYAERLAIEG